ncbi:hypothetical protein BU23DRAFT_585809 [Bimuria novae-zelandiae CBS 107.79]|uniref:HTH CENPB-type domain-containing protein n=1 Tax=Bimuria novae-zelandiae CBS 107.79 TaxID=1447943 RepID=A0A6A5UFI4_9PLEO|nr:hypothetical protein BU23DRAFT_585809 [Bimuria novae-zelandiae CBS 107.79]
MPAIDEAIAYIDSLALGEKFEYVKVAKIYSANRITLSRRHQRVQRPRVTKDSNQCTLSPHQEAKLVRYIKELTKQRLPPTRSIIRNFISKLATKDAPAIDSIRHNANLVTKYSLYFDLLQHKISKYDIQLSETYNMDKKGFAIRVISRSKRVFSKDAYKHKRVTVLALICANRSILPPSVIYLVKKGDVQAS